MIDPDKTLDELQSNLIFRLCPKLGLQSLRNRNPIEAIAFGDQFAFKALIRDMYPAWDIPFQSGFLPYIERYCDESAISFLVKRTTELILHNISPSINSFAVSVSA